MGRWKTFLQLMSMILTMVMTKKGSASMGIFTNMAVMRNTSRMTMRLLRIRTDWEILPRCQELSYGPHGA